MPNIIPRLACLDRSQLLIKAERLNVLLRSNVSGATAAAYKVAAAGRARRGVGLLGGGWDEWGGGRGGGRWLVHVACSAAAGADVGVWAGWEGGGWLGEGEAHFDGCGWVSEGRVYWVGVKGNSDGVLLEFGIKTASAGFDVCVVWR